MSGVCCLSFRSSDRYKATLIAIFVDILLEQDVPENDTFTILSHSDTVVSYTKLSISDILIIYFYIL